MPISNLEPKYLWKQFDEIRKIPHPSGHEEKLRQYMLSFAKDRNLDAKTDASGNVVIKIPATQGHENAPAIILQGHMDMVCEKNNDVDFDFMNDSIELEVEGEWLKAKGTTLGADNGVGLAAAMALADDKDAVHGPLEILATVDEETGLTGAAQLDGSLLDGKTLLNLDTEEIGAVYIGCAGGGDSTLTLPVSTMAVPSGAEAIMVKVTGLRGGHSGVDVHEQRGNAVQSLARILWKASRAHSLTVARLEGGGVHNAIPREASADCIVAAAAMDDVKKAIVLEADAIKAELSSIDPGFTVEVLGAESKPAEMLDRKSHDALLNLLLAIPHGVDTMSFEVPGLVETSNNLASVWWKEDVVIGTSSRSSSATALQAIRDRIRATAELAGASVDEGDSYPGWQPDLNSKVLEITKGVHERVFGETPVVKAIHAGLECGIIGEKVPGMDMVSDRRGGRPCTGVPWSVEKARQRCASFYWLSH
jgi:dipeptidase D